MFPLYQRITRIAACLLIACTQTIQTTDDDTVLDLKNINVLGLLDGSVIGRVVSSAVDETCSFEVVTQANAGEVTWLQRNQGLYRYQHRNSAVLQDTFQFQLICLAGPSNVATASIEITQIGLEGAAFFQDVQTICVEKRCTQDMALLEKKPIRWSRAQLRDPTDSNLILVEVMTNENGSFRFPKVVQSSVLVVVLSEALWPMISVVDNYGASTDKRSYGLVSQAIDVRQVASVELLANTGFDTQQLRYTAARSAAPFVVLDTVTQAAHRLLTDRNQIAFPPLLVNWSEQNVAETGDKSLGQITTSHWDGEQIYLLGGASSDADEFDKDVLVHEWGHYVESKLSRSDSFGGPHSRNDKLDMRVAFSEGFGNALSAIVGFPDSIYSDCSGMGGRYCFFFDVEQNGADEESRGWYSESSVHALLYDLFDPYREEEQFDTVSLPLGTLIDVMMNEHRQTPVLTSIFSFVHALRNYPSVAKADVDTLCEEEQMAVIESAMGDTEQNNGGDSAALPIYNRLTGFGSVSLRLRMANDQLASTRTAYNRMVANRYVLIEQLDGEVNLAVDCPYPVSLLLYGAGIEQYLASSPCSVDRCPTITVPNLRLSSNNTYIVNVLSEAYIAREFACTVTLSR